MRRRRLLSNPARAASGTYATHSLGFVAASLSLVAVFMSFAAPFPLYEVYRRSDGVSKTDLSVTTAAYMLAAVVALLVFGRLSNFLGRRPLAIVSLVLAAGACVTLLGVHSAAPLIVGRTLQGLSAGIASSAIAAFVVDSAPPSPSWLPAAIDSGAPMAALATGTLVSGALVQYAPHPRSLVYLVALCVLAGAALLIAVSAEPVRRTPGARASLRPRLEVPLRTRRLLPVAAATLLGTWALVGFYQAFGPTIAATDLHSRDAVVAALVVASIIAPSTLGALLSGRVAPAAAQRVGMIVFTAAVVVLLVSLRLAATVPFVLASAVAGTAQGVTFAGSLRVLLAEAKTTERAGLLAVVFAIAYTGAAVPSLIAGQLVRVLTLFEVALGYGALALVACALTLAAARNPTELPAEGAANERRAA